MKSTVKKYFRDKGYGFIKNGNGRDVYVNQNELNNCKFLRPGVEVEFECHIVSNKLVAKQVRLIHSNKRQQQQPRYEQPHFVMT